MWERKRARDTGERERESASELATEAQMKSVGLNAVKQREDCGATENSPRQRKSGRDPQTGGDEGGRRLSLAATCSGQMLGNRV